LDLTEDEINLDDVNEALDNTQGDSGAVSPVTPDPASPAESEDTASPINTRRNTMSGSVPTAPPVPPVQLSGFTEEQLQALVALVRGPTVPVRPKVRPPPEYHGERALLRTFIVQCNLYYQAIGETTHQGRIAYTKSLLRGSAAKWITPYAEGIKEETWTTWEQFVEALKKQFADVDAENTARTKIENMTQGKRPVTDYWNEYRLTSTDANYDDKTLQRLFLRGLSPTLQDAWAQDNYEVDTTEDLADWAIKKENRIQFVRSIQKPTGTTRVVEAARNQDGTFRTNNGQPRGDPMDLDATRRNARIPISTQEFQRRMRNNLCLNCAKPGHRARECKSQRNTTEGGSQTKSWTPRRTAPWQSKPAIKEMEVKEEEGPSGNESCPL
jgi:hypothetical protein